MLHSLASALNKYSLTESEIHAWVEINPREALAEGPLSGVPFGVKDIVETDRMATEYGSSLYAGRKGTFDAEIVTALRKQGAILFGKTQTTAFAYFDPAPTRNPHNPSHTPGGSSSGSAAAVAAGVVPFAIGTQTMGSIVRPASFCGVVGFKPTFATLPRHGVLPFAPSLDTVGFLAENVATCLKVWRSLGCDIEVPDRPLRFAVPTNLPSVSDEMQLAFEHALTLIRQQHDVHTAILPAPYETLLSAARTVNDYEGARTHEQHWRQHGDRIGAKLASLVERGLQVSEADYRNRLQLLRDSGEALDCTSILLTPSALGAAPTGLASTGDPIMNAVWTALGAPVIGVPMPTGKNMPLGLQMIACRSADGALLRAAADIERILRRAF